MITFDSPEADAEEETPVFAIKAQPYDKRWTPQRPWWNGSDFSSAEAFAKRFPTREAAKAELGLAMGRTYHNAVVVELNDPEAD